MYERERWPVDLLSVVILVLLTIVASLTIEAPWLRVPLGIGFILFAPGYALTAVLFPEREGAPGKQGRTISGLERLALSLGLSIAVVPLVGLLLNLTTWGIRLGPIVISLGTLTLAFCGAAYWRRSRLEGEDALRWQLPRVEWRTASRGERVLSAILILAILTAGSAVAYVVITPRPSEAFTEFYILGPDGRAENYPETLAAGEQGVIIIGVVNQEGRDTSYTIRPSLVRGTIVVSESGGSTFTPVDERPLPEVNVTVPSGATDEREFEVSLPSEGEWRLQFQLFREGDASPYRSLHLQMKTVRP